MKHLLSSIIGMAMCHFKRSALASCQLSFLAPLPAFAGLPILKQPWLGYYAVFSNKDYQFRISAADSKVMIAPIPQGETPVGDDRSILIEIGIEETLPDGKTIVRPLETGSLETADPATDKLTKVVIRGKSEGNASLEITVEQSRGIISLGSRVMDPGTFKNPLRCSVATTFPRVMTNRGSEPKSGISDDRSAKRALKEQEKADTKKLKEDSLSLKWTNGKKRKMTFEKKMDAGTKEINGTGIAAAEIKISDYGKKTVVLNASTNSVMEISNPVSGSLGAGFSLRWVPDMAKDVDGKARLAVEVK